MKKKIIIIALSIFFLYLLYRALFEYILVTVINENTYKYDNGARIVGFSHFPFVIVNPFKKQILLDKIYKYCTSEKFNIYYNFNNYKDCKEKNFFYYQKLSIEKKLVIKVLKNENNNLLILAQDKNNMNREIVFILDKKNDEIIGYF